MTHIIDYKTLHCLARLRSRCHHHMSESVTWVDADLTANYMCDGCWFGDQDCAGADKAYALKPVNRQATGSRMPGVAISREDARIFAGYCAEQMQNEPGCSKHFIGVSVRNGQCWCAKKSGNCGDFMEVASSLGHFFQSRGENEGILKGEMNVHIGNVRESMCTIYVVFCAHR